MKAPEYASGSDVQHFERFCNQLVQSTDRWDGEPLDLYEEQREFFNEALAHDETGAPIWSTIVHVLPRKNGKTVSLSAFALYRLLVSTGSPEILLAAASDKQAGRLFDAAAAFVRRSPALSGLLRVRDYIGEIVREDGRGRILRMSSDASRLYGYNPSLVVCDELAWWISPTLRRAFAALVSGGGARSRPQLFIISTAGDARTRHDSILGTMCDAAERASDVTREPGLLVARMPEAQTLCWLYSAPTTDPRDVKSMKLSNPAPWISEEYLLRQANSPELSDSSVLQLHGCVWAVSEDSWLKPEQWSRLACDREVQRGERIVLGFDGSERWDSTALIGCTLDGHVFVVGIWERPQAAPDDWQIPRDEVNAAVENAKYYYDVVELSADPPGWREEISKWRQVFGQDVNGDDIVLDFWTRENARTAAAVEALERAVYEKEITHDNNPTLAAHIANCAVKETPSGQVLTKPADRNKHIDGAIAVVIAVSRADWRFQNAPTEPQPLVFWR